MGMTIDEAIKGCQEGAFRLEREGLEDWAKAVKLGIEALKWRKEMVDDGFMPIPRLLLGETEG